MARRRKEKRRVLGPYADRGKWRVITVEVDGYRKASVFESQDEAEEFIREFRELIEGEHTIEELIDMYSAELRRKGSKALSIESEQYRLKFIPANALVNSMTPGKMQKLYERRAAEVSPGTHHKELAAARSLFKFAIKVGFIQSNPCDGIKPIGKISHGKDQLRFNEARMLFAKATKLAERGDEGAVAVLACLMLGLRSDEVRCRKVRDIDTDGQSTILWVTHGKTQNAKRFHRLADPLADLLLAKCRGKRQDDYLFAADSTTGYRSKTWLLKHTRRLCREARVKRICPHSLRGSVATLTTEAGISSHVIARELGHGSYKTTAKYYAESGSLERGRANRMLEVVR